MAKDKKPKKTKEPSQEERINEKVLNEHERLVNKLKECQPNSDEYDAVLKELQQFEEIQRNKEKNRNCDKDSKRAHIGKSLITTGGGILTALGLMGLEKTVPINGQTAKAFINSLFRHKP